MKTMTFTIIAVLIVGVLWVIKTDTKDNSARKEATPVKAIVSKLRCEQRLKGDKSSMILSYNGKSYSIFTTEKKCNQLKLNTEITVYYSKTYDKIFLSL